MGIGHLLYGNFRNLQRMILLPHFSGKRKPDLNFYLDVLNLLEVNPANCIFIDDRLYSFLLFNIGLFCVAIIISFMEKLSFVY